MAQLCVALFENEEDVHKGIYKANKMIRSTRTLVCDICGKEAPLVESDYPTEAKEGDPDYGFKTINLSGSDFSARYLHYCSPECAKQQIDNIWNNTLAYKSK